MIGLRISLMYNNNGLCLALPSQLSDGGRLTRLVDGGL